MKKVIKIVILDILGYAIGMGIFLAFFYLMPQELESDKKVVGDSSAVEDFEFGFSEMENVVQTDRRPTNSSSKDPGRGTHYDHLGTKYVEADEDEIDDIINANINKELIEEYENDNVKVKVWKKTFGLGDDKVTYYVGDVQVRNLSYFKTALAKNKYGNNIKDDTVSMAEENDAILAITGDSYGNNDTGIVVRNGVLYRDDKNDADVCVLFTDGTMKTYTAEEFDAEKIWAEGVWQAWCFGPGLMDDEGYILPEFVSTTYLSDEHPRVAIGCVSAGHYILMVVDGREEGYSRGVTLSELAALMYLENCTTAFNLDGGGSSSMVFDGEYINHATSRDISDIIYVKP